MKYFHQTQLFIAHFNSGNFLGKQFKAVLMRSSKFEAVIHEHNETFSKMTQT